MPAVNALVELTEPPWLVVALNDIEVAHFERVVYGLKNFDLVLVLKDFAQKPLQINSINMEHLEPLKSWLDSCNIKFYEGTANLNWARRAPPRPPRRQPAAPAAPASPPPPPPTLPSPPRPPRHRRRS